MIEDSIQLFLQDGVVRCYRVDRDGVGLTFSHFTGYVPSKSRVACDDLILFSSTDLFWRPCAGMGGADNNGDFGVDAGKLDVFQVMEIRKITLTRWNIIFACENVAYESVFDVCAIIGIDGL